MGLLEVFDEYVSPGLTLDSHVDAIEARIRERGYPWPRWIAADPAGQARNGQTGRSDVALLEARGYLVRCDRSRIAEGINAIRRRLDRRTLRIHPRCERLIAAMRSYHFDPTHPHRTEPVKDGPDHACDALRYLVMSLERAPMGVKVVSYV